MKDPLYQTEEDFLAACNAYFDHCDAGRRRAVVRKGVCYELMEPIPYSLPDLAVWLGYSTRGKMSELGKTAHLADAYARVTSRIEGQRVTKGLTGEFDSRFTQFVLKNCHGYKDVHEVHQSTEIHLVSDQELQARLANIEAKLHVLKGQPIPQLIECQVVNDPTT